MTGEIWYCFPFNNFHWLVFLTVALLNYRVSEGTTSRLSLRKTIVNNEEMVCCVSLGTSGLIYSKWIHAGNAAEIFLASATKSQNNAVSVRVFSTVSLAGAHSLKWTLTHWPSSDYLSFPLWPMHTGAVVCCLLGWSYSLWYYTGPGMWIREIVLVVWQGTRL